MAKVLRYRVGDVPAIRRKTPVFPCNLRIMAAIEATTPFVLVVISVPLKHLGGMPTAVQWMGPVHGIAFVFYLWMVVTSAASGQWRRSEVARTPGRCDHPVWGLSERGMARAQASCSMIYLLMKALHVASIIAFVAGLLVLAICVATGNLATLWATRRWDRRVTTPALALV
ncbi:DUF3817 domain-containing protein [Burkholderia sp. Bp9142]|uniref:DUF3817 domain-containing protein n=1 Tax=Burkholderia sp. Bp9142 TaxID=2184573 RepID=UPI0028931DB3|nr:DUF3817 domain-containing protein [Burkholderia sp. Bp9142]